MSFKKRVNVYKHELEVTKNEKIKEINAIENQLEKTKSELNEVSKQNFALNTHLTLEQVR